MSFFAFDPELEQQLNDIDEFIREQCGDNFSVEFNQSRWLLPAKSEEASAQSMSCSWIVEGKSGQCIFIKC